MGLTETSTEVIDLDGYRIRALAHRGLLELGLDLGLEFRFWPDLN